jgi:hypothetical protein
MFVALMNMFDVRMAFLNELYAGVALNTLRKAFLRKDLLASKSVRKATPASNSFRKAILTSNTFFKATKIEKVS